MREIVVMLGWLTLQHLFCVFISLPNEIKLLLFNIFFFGQTTSEEFFLICECGCPKCTLTIKERLLKTAKGGLLKNKQN